jgi:hypothetical protein
VAIAVIAAIATSFIAGCQKDDLVYSCDPEEDAIVKENLIEIREMSRQDWLQVDNNLKTPVYRAFASQQKQTFWVDKLNEALEAHEWNELERNHIIALRDAVSANPDWFILPHKRGSKKKFEEFEKRWENYAKDSLMWTDKQIFAVGETGAKLLDKSGEVSFDITSPVAVNFAVVRLKSGTENSNQPDCNCTNTLGCGGDKCNKSYQICKMTDGGCGFLGGSDCTGLCD